MMSKLGFEDWLVVDPNGHSGGLILAWNIEFTVTLIDISQHWIHVLVTSPGNAEISHHMSL